MQTDSKEALLLLITDQIKAGFLEMPISQFAKHLGIDPLTAHQYVKEFEKEGLIIEIGRGQLNRPLYLLSNSV